MILPIDHPCFCFLLEPLITGTAGRTPSTVTYNYYYIPWGIQVHSFFLSCPALWTFTVEE